VGWVAVPIPDVTVFGEFRDANGRVVVTLRLWNWGVDKVTLSEARP
jgi:hypothetical protein